MGGLARRASFIDTLRDPRGGLLIVDAGDSLAAGTGSIVPTDGMRAMAALMMRAYSQVGMDALLPGEAELSFGEDWLRDQSRRAGVEWICTNVAGRKAPGPRHKLVETGGIRVGLLGVVDRSSATPETRAVLQRSGMHVTDPVPALQAGVRALRAQGAELIVALAHAAPPRARELARQAAGIHLVVMGHAGTRTLEPEREGSTWLVEAGRRGREVGHVELRLGERWTAGSALADDSRRHRLYRDARQAVDLLGERQGGASGEDLRLRKEQMEQRARAALDEYRRADGPPPGDGHLVVRLVELDDRVPDQPAMAAMIRTGKEQVNRDTPVLPPSRLQPVNVIPIRTRPTVHRPLEVERAR